MDLEPIYCAEQIVVPADLADILKAYTKEVVRRQPEDLLEFSAIYFANLANVSGGAADSVIPPALQELRQVFEMVRTTQLVQLEAFVSYCTNAGIASTTLDAMFRLGEFSDDMVNPKEPLVLLLTMTDSTFMGVVAGLFDVFGEDGYLDVVDFLSLFEVLVAQDAAMDETFLPSLTAAVTAAALERISMAEFTALPPVTALTH